MAKKSDVVFRKLAPRLMRDLMNEFPWTVEDAAAAAGNGGCESIGFTTLQEISPTVKGSRGGAGYFQWTGPRRRQFEAWAKKKGLPLDSYEANSGFLIYELKGPEKHAIAATVRAHGLDAKVEAFELAYERAGVKNYPSRKRWARIALEAYNADNVDKSGSVKLAAPAPITDAKVVQLQQEALTRLGYPCGQPDGKVGPLTRSAIRDFRAENDLPPGEWIDDALIVAVQKAGKRQLAPERENATPADVRDKAPEVRANWLGKISSGITGAISAIGAALSGAFDHLGDAKSYLEPIKDLVGDVPLWVWLIALSAGAFFISRKLAQGEAAGVAAFREGARR